jgi:hypothetical protein
VFTSPSVGLRKSASRADLMQFYVWETGADLKKKAWPRSGWLVCSEFWDLVLLRGVARKSAPGASWKSSTFLNSSQRVSLGSTKIANQGTPKLDPSVLSRRKSSFHAREQPAKPEMAQSNLTNPLPESLCGHPSLIDMSARTLPVTALGFEKALASSATTRPGHAQPRYTADWRELAWAALERKKLSGCGLVTTNARDLPE